MLKKHKHLEKLQKKPIFEIRISKFRPSPFVPLFSWQFSFFKNFSVVPTCARTQKHIEAITQVFAYRSQRIGLKSIFTKKFLHSNNFTQLRFKIDKTSCFDFIIDHAPNIDVQKERMMVNKHTIINIISLIHIQRKGREDDDGKDTSSLLHKWMHSCRYAYIHTHICYQNTAGQDRTGHFHIGHFHSGQFHSWHFHSETNSTVDISTVDISTVKLNFKKTTKIN